MSLTPHRHPKLLALSRGRPCIKCGLEDGTIVAAHYQGFRSHAYGKGRGIKPHDAMAADLCHRCHGDADRSRLGDSREGHSRQFLLLIIASHLQRYAEGRYTAEAAATCYLLELAGNAAALLEASEPELHHTAVRLAELFDAGEITVAPGGAMVGSFVPGGVYA